MTLYAAWKMDNFGNMAAMTEISAIKVVAPNVLEKVVDMAMQIHGGAGMSRDTPGFFAQARSLRLADGPDEVHKGVIARIELAKRGYSVAVTDGNAAPKLAEQLDKNIEIRVSQWIYVRLPCLQLIETVAYLRQDLEIYFGRSGQTHGILV